MKKELPRVSAFQKKVYEVVKKIPRGSVATYAAVTRALGDPRASRAVGSALNKNRFFRVPCHRVIRTDGSVGGYAWGTEKKIARLRRENISIINGRVVYSSILQKIK